MSNKINEENKDLIWNRIPWGLLDKKTQERMAAWEHGWCRFDYYCPHWASAPSAKSDGFCIELVYRAIPAPVRRECFVNVYPTHTFPHLNRKSAFCNMNSVELLSRWKITYDEDGSNPTIEVIKGK